MSSPGSDVPPQAVLVQLILGKFVTQAVSVAAHLGLADLLRDGPRHVDELASRCGARSDTLYRLMRALAMVGVLEERAGKSFALTPVGALLRTDTAGSLAAVAKFMGEGWHSAAWAGLLDSVRTGKSAFEAMTGLENGFDWFASHPKEAQVFNDAMSSFTSVLTQAVVNAYDFSAARRVADVGGGQGALLRAILQANPSVSGVLFDRPHVVDGARQRMAAAGLTQRCEVIGGDFFQASPPGCDVYVLKHVIHDWDDPASIKILSLCASNLSPDGRVLLVEEVVAPIGVPQATKLFDLEMLVMSHGGRERTAEEYAELFHHSGLKLQRVIPTASPVSILEARRG